MVEVARRLPGARGAGHCSRATVVRWIVRGVRVGDTRVFLPAVRRGGNWFVEEAALESFLAATTAGGGAPAGPARTPAQRRRESEAAERALVAAGW